MEGSVAGHKVPVLGQPGVVPEHLDQGVVVALRGLDHPLLGGLVHGADGRGVFVPSDVR